mmetsp:Transcript_2219/g.3338  ORF Transcript_2219/g.3338 Transcript_2219/m.3338 type:complete len:113 (-) Transcript_2219:1783-2121(-)
MLVVVLQHLEPTELRPYETIFKPEAEVSEVTFFLNGTVEVGYSKRSIQLYKRPRLSRFSRLSKRARDQEPSSKDFRFSVVLNPGTFAVGLYELMFKQPPRYWYRTGRLRRLM